jgi:2-polyprenyl-6-hydroxyphenyl methylase/3-demethylubiquinone-9 3-methyltransferase
VSIGGAIRRLFGPYERQISERYRSIYVDVDAYVASLRAWVPDPRRILEVGCGEGAVSERLVALYPNAEINAIDITPNVGRLYAGPLGRVRFAETTIEAFAAQEQGKFDLIVLADVMHHVPPGSLRQSILGTVKFLLAGDGHLAFKEWERTPTPIHWLGHFSDRWITGDRISYMNGEEIRTQLREVFGSGSIRAEARVPPWRNNISLLVRS